MQDAIIPACGGTEPVSVINGRRWQYCYHPASGRHCYLDVDNDVVTWHRSFHPAFAPELEGCKEPELMCDPRKGYAPPSLFF